MPALHLSLVLRRFILGITFMVILAAQSVSAQKDQAHAASPPKYDIHAETKMKGTIEELKLSTKGSEKEIAHMLLNDGTATFDIYLCPNSFLQDMGITFKKGDEIALTGSKVKQAESELVLAREVVKGTDTLVLRDAKGSPVWSWHH